MNQIEKATTLFAGINRRDPALASTYVDPQRYVEHDPRIGDGADGLRRYVEEIALEQPEVKVVRAFQDGPCVVTQTDGHVRGDGVFFDVFRFEQGLIVEHWGFSANAGPPNRSGHTAIDGPTAPRDNENTARNKALVRDYYQAFHIDGRHDVIGDYFSDDRCVRHEPGVADGLGEFLQDLQKIMPERTIDEIKLLVAEGDFVFLAAQGTHQTKPCAYIDLYRAENGKIVEHWGFPTPIPDPRASRNGNGFF